MPPKPGATPPTIHPFDHGVTPRTQKAAAERHSGESRSRRVVPAARHRRQARHGGRYYRAHLQRMPGNQLVSATRDDIASDDRGAGVGERIVDSSASSTFSAIWCARRSLRRWRRSPALLTVEGTRPVKVPGRASPWSPVGGWIVEGAPKMVGAIGLTTTPMVPHRLAAISHLHAKMLDYSTVNIERLVRSALEYDLGAILDRSLLDNVASSSSRPAGLLNGASVDPRIDVNADLRGNGGRSQCTDRCDLHRAPGLQADLPRQHDAGGPPDRGWLSRRDRVGPPRPPARSSRSIPRRSS